VTSPYLAPPTDGDIEPLAEPPSFSVVIPAFQAEDTIAQALESVVGQTLSAHEIIVCDDGSTDGTADVATRFGHGVTVLRNERNVGESAAKNRAVAVAKGDFVVTLDADDVYRPARLASLAELAQLRPDLQILTTDADLEANGRFLRRCYERDWPFDVTDQRRAILQRNFIFGHAAVRRQTLLDVDGFDESIRWSEDWDCWARLILAGARAAAVMVPLSVYQLHPNSLSARRPDVVRGRLTTLRKAAQHPSLTSAERAIVAGSIAAQLRQLAPLELREVLSAGSRGARRRALSLARDARFPLTFRLRAAAAAVAPGIAGRIVRRRARRAWAAPGGLVLPFDADAP
jgi:GT2 family glycosyltransferase